MVIDTKTTPLNLEPLREGARVYREAIFVEFLGMQITLVSTDFERARLEGEGGTPRSGVHILPEISSYIEEVIIARFPRLVARLRREVEDHQRKQLLDLDQE